MEGARNLAFIKEEIALRDEVRVVGVGRKHGRGQLRFRRQYSISTSSLNARRSSLCSKRVDAGDRAVASVNSFGGGQRLFDGASRLESDMSG